MRNRYSDPKSGQFTQKDPIGIAGGMNLYGFADGDPVNLSDPFGLCPPENDDISDCPASLRPLIAIGRNARATNQAIGLFAGIITVGGALGGVASALGGGFTLTTLGLRGAALAPAVGGVVSQARAAGSGPGTRIFEAGRLIGELGLSQVRATAAVQQAIARLGYRTAGPPINVNGVNYILSRDAFRGHFTAIGVHPDGSTTRAIFDLSMRLVQDQGRILNPR